MSGDPQATTPAQAKAWAAALTAILATPYGRFATKGDYAAFIRDLARNALDAPGRA